MKLISLLTYQCYIDKPMQRKGIMEYWQMQSTLVNELKMDVLHWP